jgi:hypothetical protein
MRVSRKICKCDKSFVIVIIIFIQLVRDVLCAVLARQFDLHTIYIYTASKIKNFNLI